MSQGTKDFIDAMEALMNQPPEMVKVQDLDGNVYETDSNKLLAIAPAKLEFAMSCPDLRPLIVNQIQ